jgi:predicted  nucleic acid-binding Zn-ribbon protein
MNYDRYDFMTAAELRPLLRERDALIRDSQIAKMDAEQHQRDLEHLHAGYQKQLAEITECRDNLRKAFEKDIAAMESQPA